MLNHSFMNGEDGNIVPSATAKTSQEPGLQTQMPTKLSLLTGESSDSEGPLPEIDVGVSSSEQSDAED